MSMSSTQTDTESDEKSLSPELYNHRMSASSTQTHSESINRFSKLSQHRSSTSSTQTDPEGNEGTYAMDEGHFNFYNSCD